MDAIKAQRTESSKTAETQDLIRKCLIRLAAVYNYVLAPALYDIWVQALSDLSLEQIQYCFSQVEKTFRPTSACPFPVPAHVREFIDPVIKESEIEAAWQKVLKELQTWTPDVPEAGEDLGSLINYAVRGAGGWLALFDEKRANMPFRKREFFSAYQNYKELDLLGLKLNTAEMKQLKRKVNALAEKKRIQ